MSEEYPEDRGPGRPPIYPFSRMAVGDSVLIPTPDAQKISRRVSDHAPKKFKCKSVVRGGLVAVRVERIA